MIRSLPSNEHNQSWFFYRQLYNRANCIQITFEVDRNTSAMTSIGYEHVLGTKQVMGQNFMLLPDWLIVTIENIYGGTRPVDCYGDSPEL